MHCFCFCFFFFFFFCLVLFLAIVATLLTATLGLLFYLSGMSSWPLCLSGDRTRCMVSLCVMLFCGSLLVLHEQKKAILLLFFCLRLSQSLSLTSIRPTP